MADKQKYNEEEMSKHHEEMVETFALTLVNIVTESPLGAYDERLKITLDEYKEKRHEASRIINVRYFDRIINSYLQMQGLEDRV